MSLIPQAIWAKSWSHVPLKPCITKLCTFSGSPISVVGEAEVAISYGHQSARLNVVIVKGKIALFGRNWLNKISLDWHSILAVHKCSESQSVPVLDEFPSLFEDGLGKVEGKEATIQLSEGAIPKCMSARPLPYAMKAKVEVELDRLIDEGILEPVEYSEWASPIVIVKKKDDSIRLCADFKATLNQHNDPNIHPTPNPTDLLSSLSGATVVAEAPRPTDVPRLQSFLGLVNFYNRFIPNASRVLFPLNQLLQKDTPWEWSEECEAAFIEVKRVLSSTDFVLHYDPSQPVVECDASPFGVGACLLQNDRSGSLRPVACISRSLVAPEKNYSQIEQEALAIVFAVKRLHQYLYGRHFVVRTDHKPY